MGAAMECIYQHLDYSALALAHLDSPNVIDKAALLSFRT